jgi:hypothetical protein
MSRLRNFGAILILLNVLCMGASTTRAAECDDIIARHMVGEALLAAHLVAFAEQAGMRPTEITAMSGEIGDAHE